MTGQTSHTLADMVSPTRLAGPGPARQIVVPPPANSPRILVFGEGISLAHVVRPALVAAELQRRGARVIFLTAERYLPWVRQRGLAAEAIVTPDAHALYARLRRLRPMYQPAELDAMVAADLEAIQRHRPDMLLGDCRNSLRIAASLTGLPYATITNTNCTPWYAAPRTAPNQLWVSRLLGRRRVDRYLMPRFGEAGTASLCRRLARGFADAQRRAGVAEAGVCHDIREVFTSPDLTLLADLPEFQPASDLPPIACFIGPLFLGEAPEHAAETQRALAGLGGGQEGRRPLVYVTAGSTAGPAWSSAVLTALAESPVDVLVSGVSEPSGSPPRFDEPRIRHLPFACPRLVLERAAAVICHGGNGSIYQALAHGRPVIGIPGFFDQAAQCDRLETLGLGARIDLAEAPSQLAPALDRVLTDPALRQRCQTPATRINPCRSAEHAADAILALSSRPTAARKPRGDSLRSRGTK